MYLPCFLNKDDDDDNVSFDPTTRVSATADVVEEAWGEVAVAVAGK